MRDVRAVRNEERASRRKLTMPVYKVTMISRCCDQTRIGSLKLLESCKVHKGQIVKAVCAVCGAYTPHIVVDVI